jgi:hypothetical protein
MLKRQLGEAQSRVARLLAEREAIRSFDGRAGSNSGDGDGPGFVERVTSLQTRVLELEAQLERDGSTVSQRSASNAGGRPAGRPTLSSHVIPLHKLTEDSETGQQRPVSLLVFCICMY